MTRTCTGPCGQEKPLTEENFHYQVKAKGIFQTKCKACQSEYSRKRYAGNEEIRIKQRASSKISNKKTIAGTKKYILKYKQAHPCRDCGETNPVCLDFHHTPEFSKRASISRLMRDGYKLEVIQHEISKCVVVCANCHRIRHDKERQDV